MPHLRPGESNSEVPHIYRAGVQRQGTSTDGARPLPGVWVKHTRVFKVPMEAGACRPGGAANGPGRRRRTGKLTTKK